jgi:hypothetical protein
VTRAADPTAQRGSERRADLREELEILLGERGVVLVSVRLDPAPAPEPVPAGDGRLVANSDRPQHLVPARRARKVASGLGTQAPDWVRTPRQRAHRGEVTAGVLELEQATNAWAIVVVGGPTERHQRLRVGENPAPAIEPDHGSQLGDRLSLQRLAIEARLAEPLEALSASASLPGGGHRATISAREGHAYPKLLGLHLRRAVSHPAPTCIDEGAHREESSDGA